MESLLSLKDEEQLLSLLALRGGGGGGSGDPPHLRVPDESRLCYFRTCIVSIFDLLLGTDFKNKKIESLKI